MTEEKEVTTPNTEADMPERIAAFNAALQPLLGKYELGLGAMAKITPDGRVVADPVLVSMRGNKAAEAAPTDAPAEQAAPLTD